MNKVKSFLKGCLKKIRYKDYEEAEKVANKISNKKKMYMRPYYCEICMGFHLTHKKPRKKNAHIF